VVDGIENPFVFGDERTALLNRAKVVLSLQRKEWDNHSFRYYLAALNRALIVAEPTLPHTPFTPGVHLVEARVEHMADTIAEYLSDELKRGRIVAEAYRLVTTELTMKNGIRRLLDEVIAVRSTGHAVA
jgi:hypothetical protein